LAYTDHVQIFAKKSVQAMLYCAWTPIMTPGVRIKTSLALVDLVVLFMWGMTTAGSAPLDRLWWTETHDNKTINDEWLRNKTGSSDAWKKGNALEHIYAWDSPRHVPSCWNVLAASALRQFFDMAWMTKSFWERYFLSSNKILMPFWGWKAYVLMLGNSQPILLTFKAVFLYLVCGRKEEPMTSAEQAMLCATYFFTLTALLNPFRVVACKISLSLMAIKKAVIHEDVLYFLIFISVMFVFYILAFAIVDREKTLLFAFVQGFRGLIVGDGDGLDFLGLATDDDIVEGEEAHKFRTAFGTLGMILFFTYLMQLLIAIFSNTYDSAIKNVWLHFHQARAQDLRDAILGHHKFRQNSTVMGCMKSLGVAHLLCKPYIFWIGLVTFVMGLVAQIGIHYIPEKNFPELVYVAAAVVSILFLSLGAVLLESSVFMWRKVEGEEEDDWFPAVQEYWDELKVKHRLFVFCRADYDESYFLGDDQVEVRIEKVQDKVKQLDEAFEEIEKTLRQLKGSS